MDTPHIPHNKTALIVGGVIVGGVVLLAMRNNAGGSIQGPVSGGVIPGGTTPAQTGSNLPGTDPGSLEALREQGARFDANLALEQARALEKLNETSTDYGYASQLKALKDEYAWLFGDSGSTSGNPLGVTIGRQGPSNGATFTNPTSTGQRPPTSITTIQKPTTNGWNNGPDRLPPVKPVAPPGTRPTGPTSPTGVTTPTTTPTPTAPTGNLPAFSITTIMDWITGKELAHPANPAQGLYLLQNAGNIAGFAEQYTLNDQNNGFLGSLANLQASITSALNLQNFNIAIGAQAVQNKQTQAQIDANNNAERVAHEKNNGNIISDVLGTIGSIFGF